MKILVDRDVIQNINQLLFYGKDKKAYAETNRILEDHPRKTGITNENCEWDIPVSREALKNISDHLQISSDLIVSQARRNEAIEDAQYLVKKLLDTGITDAVIVERDKLNVIFNLVSGVKDGLEGSDELALQGACDILKSFILDKFVDPDSFSQFPKSPIEENKSFDKELIELKKRVVYLEEMTGHCLLLKGY